MDALIPRAELEAVIRPHYYAGKRGGPPRGIEALLRMYLLQVWYNLPDEMAEEEIYGSHAMKEFLRVDFQEEGAPDAAALLGFRHLLEQHGLQKQLFEKINQILEQEGMLWRGGSIIDAAVIEAPGSTKNSSKSRDPEMKQTRRGNERHFGMKAHIGADAGAGMAHNATFTAANEHGIQEAHKLVRAEGAFVNAGAGYIGIEKREEIIKDEHLPQVQRRVNERKGKARRRAKALYKDAVNRLEWVSQPRRDENKEYMKSKVRSKAGDTFYIIKHLYWIPENQIPGDSKKRSAAVYAICGGKYNTLVMAA